MARQVLENGVILPAEYSDDWYDDMTSNLTKLDDVIGSDSEKLSSADVGAAALSNSYNDLDNLPTIPTKTSDLTNDSNFVDTSNSAVASGITSSKVTDYDTHIADTDIHVTTSDKSKWNNGVSQSYVFRYSSTALTASSTNSNSLLDNTDNLKVGDKVIDSSGVLFSVTAIDTANSTFTIGTALIDLAQDSDVVHKSGNETISGVKTITDTNLEFKSTFAEYGVSAGDSSIIFRDKNNLQTFKMYSRVFFSGVNCNLVSFFLTQKVDNTYYTSNGIQLFANTDNKNAILRPILANNNADGLSISLGASDRRWQSVYANNYYYGANNVEFSDKFVTTDTNQSVSGQKVFSDINAISNSAEIGVSAGNNSFKVLDKNKKIVSRLEGGTFSGGMAYSYWLVNNGSDVFNGISLYQPSANIAQLRPYSSTLSLQLGASNRYFSDCYTSKINGLEPSSLSLPSGNASDVIDISSYLVYLDGTANTYTAPANGWISITISSCSGIQAYINGLWGNQIVRPSAGGVRFLMPVVKNLTVNILIFSGTIDNARFIPCQGNV